MGVNKWVRNGSLPGVGDSEALMLNLQDVCSPSERHNLLREGVGRFVELSLEFASQLVIHRG